MYVVTVKYIEFYNQVIVNYQYFFSNYDCLRLEKIVWDGSNGKFDILTIHPKYLAIKSRGSQSYFSSNFQMLVLFQFYKYQSLSKLENRDLLLFIPVIFSLQNKDKTEVISVFSTNQNSGNICYLLKPIGSQEICYLDKHFF